MTLLSSLWAALSSHHSGVSYKSGRLQGTFSQMHMAINSYCIMLNTELSAIDQQTEWWLLPPSESLMVGGWPKWGWQRPSGDMLWLGQDWYGNTCLCYGGAGGAGREHQVFPLKPLQHCFTTIITFISFWAFLPISGLLCFYMPLTHLIDSCSWESDFTSLGFNNIIG